MLVYVLAILYIHKMIIKNPKILCRHLGFSAINLLFQHEIITNELYYFKTDLHSAIYRHGFPIRYFNGSIHVWHRFSYG